MDFPILDLFEIMYLHIKNSLMYQMYQIMKGFSGKGEEEELMKNASDITEIALRQKQLM